MNSFAEDYAARPAWVLQIAEGVEVITWWYGEPEGYRDEPDLYKRMNTYQRTLVDWAFDGLEPKDGLAAPVELDRTTAVVWRFRSRRWDDTGWQVAPSREAALEAARAYAERHAAAHPRETEPFLDALQYVETTTIARTFDDFMASMPADHSDHQG